MDDIVIEEFHRRMTYERENNNFIYEAELTKSFKQILLDFALDYSEYRKYVPKFLSSLETNNSHSVSYSLKLFFDLYKQLTSSGNFESFDLSIMQYEADDSTLEKMKPIFQSSYLKSNQQRLSEDNFDISNLSDEEKKEMACMIIEKIQIDSKEINWSREMVDIAMMQFTFLRQLLVSLDNTELFYYSLGLLFDRLTSSEYYQAGRDIAEEVIIAAFKDGFAELGYFNSFRIYSNNGSIQAGLLYANLSMICILQKNKPISDKYVKEIIWQGIKFFRNVRLYPWAIQIYNDIPTGLNYLDSEKRSIDHSYFTSLVFIKDPSLPSLLLDYLHKKREEVLSGGINEALPWLITLYNVRRLYPQTDFSTTGFGLFLNIFETIVPPNTIKKYKDIIEGNSPDLKSHLKESLVKLNETRNATDFIYDNESGIRISSRLIEYCVINKDAPSFLLSMMLKSDYSILFRPKESKELSPLILPEINIDALEILYDDQHQFLKVIPICPNNSMIWIASSEEKLFELQLLNSDYSFFTLPKWSFFVYKDLVNSDYFINLSFSDTIVERQGVRLISPEEFKKEESEIIKKLSIAQLSIDDNAEGLYVVKDMELSKFPHNLFLNNEGDFIAKHIPVANVLSTEWLLQTNEAKPLSTGYSKSIWIPIESGDMALNYLYGNIEQTLKEHSFEIFEQVELANPLSSDINIVCSHGAKNISEVQIVFQKNNPPTDLHTIVGRGKILIFFVCFSGSMKTEFFRNNVNSLVKRFIAQGYETVIAPFWALDVTIPRYWLPEFLESLDANLNVSQAAFNASKKVYEQYPTPAAWACLHLYGNPNLKIQ